MGNFNSYLGFLGPQKINKNGKFEIELAEKQCQTLLNSNENYERTITRQQRGEKNVIDLALVNDRYKNFKKVVIDQSKIDFELQVSYHCLIMIYFKLKQKNRTNKRGKTFSNIYA